MIGESEVLVTRGLLAAAAGWREAMLIAGIRVFYRAAGQGTLHCQRCGGDRPYRHRTGRRWFHLLGVPVVPLARAGPHLRCVICRTCYRTELLAVPTTAQMQVALLTGTRSASLAMLRAGNSASLAARRRAIELIRGAGAPDFDAAQLGAALARPGQLAGTTPARGAGQDLEVAVAALALQLEAHAREWFLANVVRIGLADGSLSAGERQVVRTIAKSLGMTQAQAQDVIWLAEEAAQAG
ncbi:MAG TPA: TerB family tellurite resistance protein [Streptosporangiaceae bacterium]|nr:TerB family tellurite resistance protein [Streptosporangiaceae bacterium]